MINQITIGFATEGTTDVRFLESIIQRTFEEVAFDCTAEIEVLPLQYLPKETGNIEVSSVSYAKKADELGIMVLCLHKDADDKSDANAFQFNILPAFRSIESNPDIYCKNLVAIVPVQMSEAWMLADTELLKDEIGTDLTDQQLNIYQNPESIADPKKSIIDAIRIARQTMTRRTRRDLKIGELYQPVGQKIELVHLKKLPSYLKFREAVQRAFQKLNYLH